MKIFIEQQRFNQWWLYVIYAISLIGMLLPLKTNFEELKENSVSRIVFLFSFLMVLLVILLLSIMRLNTKIDEVGVSYRFFPFHRNYKVIYWRDINTIYVRKYLAIIEYGGWGYKSGFFSRKGRGLAYSVKGNKGIQLELNNGKKILLGTQKENEAKKIIKDCLSNYLNRK